MAAVTALTALAITEDARNESYQKGRALAEEEASRARTLALEGVPPPGGIAVFDNDPKQKTRKLFKENCSTCHTIEGRGGEEAPNFDDYNSREWLFALVRDPHSKRFFGGTKGHTQMKAVPASDASDEQLHEVLEYVLSLQGPEAGTTDAAMVAKGKALWDSKLECTSCHEVEAGKSDTGPTLAGRGTPAWIARVIRNSAEPDLFGETAEMPKFADKLSPEQIKALADFIFSQRGAKKAAH
jgi:ubiquinol-cytochrome c reductase cytochrome b subunit